MRPQSLVSFLICLLFPSIGLASEISDLQEKIAPKIRERLIEVISGAENAVHLPGMQEQLSFGWWISTLWPVLIFMLVAWFLSGRLSAWGRKHFEGWYNPAPETRADKISYLLFRFVMMTVNLVVFVVISITLIALFTGHAKPDAPVQSVLVLFVAVLRVPFIILDALIAPDAPAHRLIHLSDQQALKFRNNVIYAHAPTSFAISVCLMMDHVGLSKDIHLLFLIAAVTIGAVVWTLFAIFHRQIIAQMILGPHAKTENKHGFRQVLAASWHILFAFYIILAWAVTVARLLLDLPSAYHLLVAPMMILLFSIGGYGIALLVIDKVAINFGNYRQKVLANSDEDFGGTEDIQLYEKAWQSDLVKLAEKAVAFLVAILAIGALLETWGIDVSSSDSLVVRLGDIFIVCFVSYVIYRAVKLTLDRRIKEETVDEQEAEPGDEGGSAGSATRLATLLPLFRNFLLITIVSIGIMLALTQMGVDIGPLFAGAGVVGVAIGFGAQTLIQDIFSGAFFLFDDAFRKGEYVEIDGTRGTVEKISIRSFQLRHHLGALHTIPFGQIAQLTNYSRDWAMMKLQLRVTYDTDVEQVRKLIKKLGQELLSHPEVGDKFIQPLKSQGVLAMEDSAMILRVKFMTPPGEQFVVRKLVFAKIRELFEEHGIKFAHREVTVRVAPGVDTENMTEEDKQKIGEMAAAAALQEEQNAEANAPTDDR
ncbi:mechanosensitive ion channel [Sneathiella sp. P13V-1]|uniref:mechanosensitive ion channel family protein n=1 Tax=Sneathiella sp. P13V-1 TaxID=2697366 RepID=UPI00187B89AC|nr:mechanosensitive ion channel family protein [Sneathiella sp. P13V-1]MBE7637082.1 mechanosensitive ion channel [Sneathiella sp. P13V-1]